ncbi:MAG: rhomboid family intramembrane serine protease [Saprospiraceae bacterium]|nr:rhomboid family intramembrane serine protease [Saprospiraceae bacterium]
MTITTILVLLTGIISVQAFQRPAYHKKLAHHPYSVYHNKEWYRLITAGFVHGSWAHLLINMFVLWMFGERIELYYTQIWGPNFGRLYYILVYLVTVFGANIPSLLKHKDNPSYYSIGASGGVSGIVFIFILFHPWEKLYLYFILPIYGIVAGILYLIYSHWASRRSNDNIDHSAHFYGAILGMAFTVSLKPSLINLFIARFMDGLPF